MTRSVNKMPLKWKLLKSKFSAFSRFLPSSDNDHRYENVIAEISPEICNNQPNFLLKFDEKSVAFCVGIDAQHDSTYAVKNQDDTIRRDAIKMGEALIGDLGLSSDQVKISISSSDHDACTKNGLYTSFLTCAEMAKENGIFIFYFAGHCCEIGNRSVLAPADFNKTKKSGITGDDLVEWLTEAECKAKNVLFIFDCCYAGQLGEILTKKEIISTNFFAICACSAKEKNTSLGELKHSIFTYFLLDYIKTSVHNGEFYIQQAKDKVADLCYGLSSLIMIYDEGKLHCGEINPELYKRVSKQPCVSQRCLPNKEPTKAINSLLQLLFKKPVTEKIHTEVKGWLQFSTAQESYRILYDKAKKSEILQKCIISVLFRSMALIQYEKHRHDENLPLARSNMFLLIATEVSNAVDFCNLTIDHIKVGLDYYIDAYKSTGDKYISYDELLPLDVEIDNLKYKIMIIIYVAVYTERIEETSCLDLDSSTVVSSTIQETTI